MSLLLVAAPVLTQSGEPCDCSQIVDTCEARLSGRETLEWRGPSEAPFLTVESCQVCRDMGVSALGVANTVDQCRYLDRTVVIRDQEGHETRQLREYSENVMSRHGSVDAGIASLRQSIEADLVNIDEIRRTSKPITSNSTKRDKDAHAVNQAAIVEFQDWISLKEAAIVYLHCRAR